ncbi:FtsX-like permease family protein [Kitasatospora sp. NBC_01287]|uniref:FtsX-like permease family protein n=1 Tax=Kitasatospora sp. NBC_01287 TaxID=2903573 RepID=UPI00224FCA04|nr:FtsX-like permease family protein [Kitasatospora sp. NBC_01287]MCX4748153.1 FtsX-like permease family protein [Kitasatospora sp. NBC_01287]
MIRIALRTLRFHRIGFLASFIAMFLGAMIVVGCGGLLETGIHDAAPPHRLAAAPIVVSGDQLHPDTRNGVFPERVPVALSLVDGIRSIPGVSAAVPDVSFPAALVPGGGHGIQQTTGRDWSAAQLSPYALDQGSAPTGSSQVALDSRLAASAGLRIGSGVALDVHGGTRQFTVTALVSGPGDAATVFFADADAMDFAVRPDTADAIGVFTTPGSDPGQVRGAISALVAGEQVDVLVGDERGRAEDPAVVTHGKNLIPLAAVFGGLSVMVTVFVVAGTLGLSIQQRRREMALLRATGATPGQLRRLILGETMLVALIATALACYPGPRLGRQLLAAFVHGGVVPAGIVYRAGAVPMFVGAGVALLTALGAAWIAGRRAALTRPIEALAEAALQRRWFSWVRLLFAVLCLAGGTALALVTALVMDPRKAGSTATPGAMLWVAGFGLLGPGLSKVITALLRRPLAAFTGFSGQLAMLNAKARSIRLSGAVMPVMLATGLATSLIYLQTTQAGGDDRAFTDNLRADLVLTSATGGLPPALVDTVQQLPGVAAASALTSSSLFLEPAQSPAQSPGQSPAQSPGQSPAQSPAPQAAGKHDRKVDVPDLPVFGVSPQGVAGTTSIQVLSGSLDDLSGDTVALPTADLGGHRLGDLVPTRLGDGTPVSLRLVATVSARRGYETALVPAPLLLGHTTSGLLPQILVRGAAGQDTAQLSRRLSALAGSTPGLRVVSRDQVTAAHQDSDNTQAWMAYLLVVMVIGYAAIALVNTQVMATAERRGEFSLQRLIGATRGQVLRMTTVESLLVALAGLLLGTLVAAATLVPLSLNILGSPIPAGPVWIFLVVVVAALALTLSTTLLSTAVALRVRPALAVAGRD